MRRAAWVAADLAAELLAAHRAIWLNLFLVAQIPLVMGVADGSASGQPAAGYIQGRHSLLMMAAGPGLVSLMALVQLLESRRQARQLEPLMAAPISDRELAAAILMVALVPPLALPAITFPLSGAAFRMAAGHWPPMAAGDLVRHVLALQVAAVVGSLTYLGRIVRGGRGPGASALLAAGLALLGILDLLFVLMRWATLGWVEAPLLAAIWIAGVVRAVLTALKLDREALILRS